MLGVALKGLYYAFRGGEVVQSMYETKQKVDRYIETPKEERSWEDLYKVILSIGKNSLETVSLIYEAISDIEQAQLKKGKKKLKTLRTGKQTREVRKQIRIIKDEMKTRNIELISLKKSYNKVQMATAVVNANEVLVSDDSLKQKIFNTAKEAVRVFNIHRSSKNVEEDRSITTTTEKGVFLGFTAVNCFSQLNKQRQEGRNLRDENEQLKTINEENERDIEILATDVLEQENIGITKSSRNTDVDNSITTTKTKGNNPDFNAVEFLMEAEKLRQERRNPRGENEQVKTVNEENESDGGVFPVHMETNENDIDDFLDDVDGLFDEERKRTPAEILDDICSLDFAGEDEIFRDVTYYYYHNGKDRNILLELVRKKPTMEGRVEEYLFYNEPDEVDLVYNEPHRFKRNPNFRRRVEND